jgi:hypothetical protein
MIEIIELRSREDRSSNAIPRGLSYLFYFWFGNRGYIPYDQTKSVSKRLSFYHILRTTSNRIRHNRSRGEGWRFLWSKSALFIRWQMVLTGSSSPGLASIIIHSITNRIITIAISRGMDPQSTTQEEAITTTHLLHPALQSRKHPTIILTACSIKHTNKAST